MNTATGALSTFESLLGAWGADVSAGPARPGQHRNDVRTVMVDGREYVGRRSGRPAESVEWELALLQRLAEAGVAVPTPLRTLSGAAHHRGLTLTPRLPGHHPETDEEWTAVVRTARRIHEVTRDWPQRPDVIDWSRVADPRAVREWAARVGLDPHAAVEYAAARADLPRRDGVTVGRTRRRDIVITEAGPVFVDWDEARVDCTLLDFVGDERLVASASIDVRQYESLRECDRRWIVLRGLPPA